LQMAQAGPASVELISESVWPETAGLRVLAAIEPKITM
jgi:hypothetical protein